MIEKVFKTAAGVRAAWDGGQATFFGWVAEAMARPEFESEDIVTELINRMESSLEQARQLGGDAVGGARSRAELGELFAEAAPAVA